MSPCIEFQGHRYDEANTYQRLNGGRDCRACHKERSKSYRAASSGEPS